MNRDSYQRNILLGLATAIFLTFSVLPVLYMFGASFVGPTGSFSIASYRHLLIDQRQRVLLLNTLLLGAGTTLAATVIGAPLGFLLARCDLPAKRLLRLMLTIPLALPSYILGLSWIYIGGSAGIVSKVAGQDLLSGFTYSLGGAVAVLALNFFPLSMLATEAAASRVETHLEEAALMVAPVHRVLWRVTLPLMAPGVAAAALVIFVLAISEFAVPSLLRIPVFTTEVFTAFASLYDFGAATVLSLPLLILALIAGISVRSLIGNRPVTTQRGFDAGLHLSLGRWRPQLFALIAVILFVSVIAPVGVLARETRGVGALVSAFVISGGAIVNSILLAIVGALLIAALATLLAYGVARVRARLQTFSEVALLVTFAVPSTVVGVGIISLWNRPGLPGELYQSLAIIVVAYLARFTPVATLILVAAVRQVSSALEEAAELSGASWLRRLTAIVLPQIRSGVTAAFLVSFIFAFGELGATMLVTPPGSSTLPVHVYTMIANAPPRDVAALALMQMAMILIPLALLGIPRFSSWRRSR